MSIMSVVEEGQVRDGYLPSRLDQKAELDKSLDLLLGVHYALPDSRAIEDILLRHGRLE